MEKEKNQHSLKVKLIINPTAGQCWNRDGLTSRERIETAFRGEGFEVESFETGAAGDATIAARSAVNEGFGLVIAAGGDGTVNEVMNGLVGSDTAFSVIPLGTENILARAMKIPFNIESACRHISRCGERRVDVGEVHNRRFLLFAGIGLDAHVVSTVPPELKKLLGSLAFFITGLRIAWKYRKLKPVAIIKAEETCEVPFWLIVVGNISTYGWQVEIAPQASMDDGFLDVCIFTKTTYWGIIRQIMGAFAGIHVRFPEITYFKTRGFEIKTDPPVKIQIDGEVIGETPCLFKIVPGALKVRF